MVIRDKFKIQFKICLFVLATSFWNGVSKAQINTVSKVAKVDDYKLLWKKTDSLVDKGLTLSAQENVSLIYHAAKKEQNQAQLIKSIIYKIKLVEQREEFALQTSIDFLREEIKSASFPLKPLLQSLIASAYWSYYQNNRWLILDRKTTLQKDSADISTWSRMQFVEVCTTHFLWSLQQKEKLQQIKIDLYDEIISKGATESRKLRPTLYDFLAHRALSFFMSDEDQINPVVSPFDFSNPELFLPAQQFAHLKIADSDDTLDFSYRTIKLMQELLLFHLRDQQVDALIDADLLRLEYVFNQSHTETKDSSYVSGLAHILSSYPKSTMSSEAALKMAQYHLQQSYLYRPLYSSEKKWSKREALTIADKIISKFPGTYAAKEAQLMVQEIKKSNFSLKTEDVNEPGKPARFLVSYKNAEQLYFKIVKHNPEHPTSQVMPLSSEQKVREYLKQKPVTVFQQLLPNDKDYNTHRAELSLPPMEMGNYVLLACTQPDFNMDKAEVVYVPLVYSNMAYMHRCLNNGTVELYVLNRFSGSPLSDVTIRVYKQSYDYSIRKYRREKTTVISTDLNGKGIISFPENEKYSVSYFVEISKGKDVLYSEQPIHTYKGIGEETVTNRQTHFFLDRSIYRPGQHVYFKAIRVVSDSSVKKTERLAPLNIKLMDVNNQEIASLILKTNEFGSASGSFILPQHLLNGQMQITDGFGTAFLQVEEYKRPKFEVILNQPDSAYRLNDLITIEGKAISFAGYQISNAKVTYRVVRHCSYYSPYLRDIDLNILYPKKEIKNGITKTNDKGIFNVVFPASATSLSLKDHSPVYDYTVFVDVTDENGETRSNEVSITISQHSTQLELWCDENIDAEEKSSLKIKALNSSGVPVKIKGEVKLFALQQPNRIFRERKWEQPDQYVISKVDYYRLFPFDEYAAESQKQNWEKSKLIKTFEFNTAETEELNWEQAIKSIDPGVYLLEASAKDKTGEEIKSIRYISVYSRQKNIVPDNNMEWFHPFQSKVNVGDTARFILASASDDVPYLFEIEHKGKIIYAEFRKANFKTQEIYVQEKFEGNFTYHIHLIKNNRFYSHSRLVEVPFLKKELEIKLATFRNKILPGKKEEWKISVKNKESKKENTELLVSMYDASLDVFQPHDWQFKVYPYYNPQVNLFCSIGQNRNSTFFTKRAEIFKRPEFRTYDKLNGFGSFWDNEWMQYPAGPIPLVKAAMADNMLTEAAAGEEIKKENMKSVSQSADKNQNLKQEKTRTNFAETAFFYPQLKTDSNGVCVFSFTSPESLSKWKFQVLAHSKDLKIGQLSETLITQKELMAEANAPRFFRSGDEIRFSVKLTSIAPGKNRGRVKLQFYDALTNTPIGLLMGLDTNKSSIPFDLDQNQSKSFFWSIKVPENIQAITYHLSAETPSQSDAEEKTIPVLSNQIAVTESFSFNLKGKQNKKLEFRSFNEQNKNSTTLKNRLLSFEYTSNPSWYAIQALPYLMDKENNCSEEVFSRYYANSIAFTLMNAHPKIKQVFEQWNTFTPETFYSQLEKNQELKEIVLQETPWIVDAAGEQETKRRIALFFDLNTMANQLKNTFDKLVQMQLSNGSWPWFEGGQDDRYITGHIISGLGHLDKLGIIGLRLDQNRWQVLSRAVNYLDKQMALDFQELKKAGLDKQADFQINAVQIQYLYARSFFKDIPVDEEDKVAIHFFKEQAINSWLSQSRYLQGMIALSEFRAGNLSFAKIILESLKQNALHSEELGMYWKEQGNDMQWHHSKIETQALLTEVFREIGKDIKLVDELKIALLKNKQTNNWKTTKATCEAVYALLSDSLFLLTETEQTNTVKVQIGNMKIDPSKDKTIKLEAGTGYLKRSWTTESIKPTMGMISIKKKSAGMSWGALHWQYLEEADKINANKGDLNVSRELYLISQTSKGIVLVPVDENYVLHPGDKLNVRLIVKTNRDMEYVHLKDMRAGCLEPVYSNSGYQWKSGVSYYQTNKDAASHFYFSGLNKGTCVIDYTVVVTHSGVFKNGIASIQCLYAPEFNSHTEGTILQVRE